MKKIISIALSAAFLGGLFALPAGAQLSPVNTCTLTDNISIQINVVDVPPTDVGPAGFGELIPASRILSVESGSVVSSSVATMALTPPNVTDTASPTTFVAADEDQIDALSKKWGDICLVNTINRIVNWIFFIMLTVAFALIVIAAFIWVTSGGDTAKQQTARSIIIAAMVGLVIAIFARILPAVVLGIVT